MGALAHIRASKRRAGPGRRRLAHTPAAAQVLGAQPAALGSNPTFIPHWQEPRPRWASVPAHLSQRGRSHALRGWGGEKLSIVCKAPVTARGGTLEVTLWCVLCPVTAPSAPGKAGPGVRQPCHLFTLAPQPPRPQGPSSLTPWLCPASASSVHAGLRGTCSVPDPVPGPPGGPSPPSLVGDRPWQTILYLTQHVQRRGCEETGVLWPGLGVRQLPRGDTEVTRVLRAEQL